MDFPEFWRTCSFDFTFRLSVLTFGYFGCSGLMILLLLVNLVMISGV